jgi:hypothetical protein
MALQRLPDVVEVLRPSGPDVYGNPVGDWDTPTVVTTTKGLLALPDLLIMRAGTDVRLGDRVTVNGAPYTVTQDPIRARSMTAEKAVVARIEPVDE